ncbi:uncharacterized protein LOC114536715 [Dendronephthya gigantea]|uniref:uncharacterized protein LOC114536715 n=1 Tax=Dendronephthya gigantea TaxID=151771 RepID=UPI001068EF44|nr:uncharacterized protein LOC114536715 [Dendronephthya gigantea]
MKKMHGAYEYVSSVSQATTYLRDSFKSEFNDLPDHLQISYECDKNPWQNIFMQDFIMVAEFSEHEGPRPLFTIPDDAGKIFDKNAFSVHVMSVDYHAQSGVLFSLVDDTQLIFSEDRENIYAYVHHFILHDIEARGFVRPYCMCYISNCKKKIMDNLENFIDEFSKISNHFKAANKPLFLDDLKQRLADLKYVQDCLENIESEDSEWVEVSQKACKNLQGLNTETVDSMLTEAERAITVMKAAKTATRENTAEGEVEKNSSTESSKKYANKNYDEEVPKLTANGQDTSCYELTPGGQIHDEIIERLIRERKRHLIALRDIHALCGYRAVEGLASLQRIHQHFYQPYEVFSIIKEETPLLDPFSSSFAIGSSFVMNFRKDIHLSKVDSTAFFSSDAFSKNSFESARSELSSESFQSCVEDNESDREGFFEERRRFFTHTPFSVMTTKDLIGGGNFSDGISDWASSFNGSPSSASLADLSDDSTIERSYTPTPLVSDTEPILAPSSRASLAPRPLSGSTGDLPSTGKNSSLPFRRQFSAVETQTNHLKDMLRDVLPSTKKSENVQEEEDVAFFAPGSTPQYKVIYKDMCEVGLSETGSGDGRVGMRRLEKINLQCYAQQLCRRKSDGPGGGVLRVLRNHGYLVHLLYALLSGRTVVILADSAHQRNVENLITSLWLFVPGDCRTSQQVVLWRTKPLKLSDLGRIKLVGLAKSKQFKILPNSVQMYVSMLDYESGTLTTPPYQGEFLNEMLALRRYWKSDAMFISYIHSVFLEISLKAFVCFCAISLRSSATDANLPWKKRKLIPREFSLEFMTDILDALGVLGSDVRIVMYILDLVSHQQIADLPSQRLTDNASLDSLSLGSANSCENSDSSSHMSKTRPITLDFTQRVVYKRGSDRPVLGPM